jgi:hypothetical protein
MQLNEAFAAIISGTKDIMGENGFAVVNANDPVVTDGEHSYVDFAGDKGKIRVDIFGNQAILYYTDVNADEATDDDFKKASANYFNLDEFDQRDLKSLCNEFNDTVESKFGSSKASAQGGSKKPATVSKAAVKSGAQFYDPNTLASRISAIYPELKPYYQENYDKYGELLAEEFFENYGAAPIINTIRYGSDSEMKKVFKALNECFEDGTSDVQGVIAVTILGKMNNEERLISRAKEYMCDETNELVVLINQYLASGKGEKIKEKLKNPPPYKPKKQKKPGFFSQMMAAGNAQGGMPPQM